MALLPVVTVGDPGDEVLFKAAQRVRDFGPGLHKLLDEMLETMREAPGVGLAAPQVGLGLRAAVVEYPEDEEDPDSPKRVYEIINPEIVKKKGAEVGQEGCLSIPGLAADVERGWSEVVLGTRLTRSAGLLAAIVAQGLVLAVLAVATVAGILGVGWLVGAGFDPAPFLAASAIMWLFGCAVAGVTSLLGAVTLSRAVAGGIAAGVLLLMYLMNVVAQVQPDLAWLADFGAFKYLAVTELVDEAIVPWASIAVFTVVAVVGWVASIAVFRRRDLLA